MGTLLYLRFPQEKFKVFCQNAISDFSTEHTATIDSIQYSFPWQVSLQGVRFETVDSFSPDSYYLKSVNIRYTPEIGLQSFLITASLYSGELRGDLSLASENKTFTLANLNLVDIDIVQIIQSLGFTNRKVTGNINFNGSYRGSFTDVFGGHLSGSLLAENGFIELVQPILTMKKIPFDQIETQLHGNLTHLNIEKGELAGALLAANFSGYAVLQEPLSPGRISITGHLQTTQQMLAKHPRQKKMFERLRRLYNQDQLPFSLQGTFRKPTLTFQRR